MKSIRNLIIGAGLVAVASLSASCATGSTRGPYLDSSGNLILFEWRSQPSYDYDINSIPPLYPR